MNLTIRTDYWEDRAARGAFKAFMREIFDLDFTEWDDRGYWDDAYRPYSFFLGDQIVASACVYSLDAVISGERSRLLQISGVGTLPEWRRQGLSRQLTESGLVRAGHHHAGVFLFATNEAIPCYRNAGFLPIDEYVEWVTAPATARRGGAAQLDPGRKPDLDRIFDYAQRRVPISNVFSVLNPRLVVFHALHSLREHIYEIPDLDCLVFMERAADRLRVYDIVGARIPSFDKVYPYLADPDDRIIEFHFTTDQLGLPEPRSRRLLGNNPFVKEGFPLARPVFPHTARA